MIEGVHETRERGAEEFGLGLQAARDALNRGQLHTVAYVLGVRVEDIHRVSGSLHNSRPDPSL